MADSEVRQKELMTLELKAMIRKIETFRTSLPDKLRIMQRFYDAVFEAGMRAREIAQREMKSCVRAALEDAMESWQTGAAWLPEGIERAEAEGKTRDVEKFSRWKAESEEAVAQIAEFLVPAAPEEKKP